MPAAVAASKLACAWRYHRILDSVTGLNGLKASLKADESVVKICLKLTKQLKDQLKAMRLDTVPEQHQVHAAVY